MVFYLSALILLSTRFAENALTSMKTVENVNTERWKFILPTNLFLFPTKCFPKMCHIWPASSGSDSALQWVHWRDAYWIRRHQASPFPQHRSREWGFFSWACGGISSQGPRRWQHSLCFSWVQLFRHWWVLNPTLLFIYIFFFVNSIMKKPFWYRYQFRLLEIFALRNLKILWLFVYLLIFVVKFSSHVVKVYLFRYQVLSFNPFKSASTEGS